MLRGLSRFAHRLQRGFSADTHVEVSEIDGVRSLYLGSDTIQSSMRVNTPFALELKYSRGMMGFLLFYSNIKDVLMVGLGGGSLPKYLHEYLPTMVTRVVEINPRIIQTARSHFYVPENDEKLQVMEGDGIAYLQQNPATAGLLMIDAFDSQGIPADMGSQNFFDSCAAALTHDGMLAINLWGSDKNFDVYLQRIEQSFGQRVLILRTGRPGNIIVFGFRRASADLRWNSLRERAKTLETSHNIEFLEFVEKLREHNPNTSNRLLLNGQ